MATIDVSNRGKRWSETDSERLKTLYRQAHCDLVTLAGEFKRTPCSIWSKLMQYNIISEPEEVRGYDLYLAQYAERYASLPPKPAKSPKEPTPYCRAVNDLRNDIQFLQKDLQEIKTLIQEVLALVTT